MISSAIARRRTKRSFQSQFRCICKEASRVGEYISGFAVWEIITPLTEGLVICRRTHKHFRHVLHRGDGPHRYVLIKLRGSIVYSKEWFPGYQEKKGVGGKHFVSEYVKLNTWRKRNSDQGDMALQQVTLLKERRPLSSTYLRCSAKHTAHCRNFFCVP